MQRHISSRARSPMYSLIHRRTIASTAQKPPSSRLGRLYSSKTSYSEEENFGSYNVILPSEPYVWGISHINPRQVPPHITRPPYAATSLMSQTSSTDAERGYKYSGDGRIELGGSDEARLRRAAQLAKFVLQSATQFVKVGATTDSIDAALHDLIISHSAYPSPLHYLGFPRASCISVNNVIVHGIPDDRPLEDGDIVNIDITVYLDGYHGDTSRTFLVGQVDEPGRDLIRTTNEALQIGIDACGPGRPFKGIGKAIHDLAWAKGYSVSSQFTGHGIGTVFHRPPWILHHLNDEPGVMLPGHCFTVEPCLIQGSNPRGWIFPDGWTTSTENCARAAQAEHMVLITESGIDVLTQ